MMRIFYQNLHHFQISYTTVWQMKKRKFVVPINTTYFIKYVFRLYTKNTGFLDIGPYFGQWKETFSQPF